MRNERNYYFDFLRGLSILMVVAIHTFKMSGMDSAYGIWLVCSRQIFNIAVPLFLAISGYFLGKKNFDNVQQVSYFWKRQIPKVYVPMLIWSIPYFCISLYSGGAFFKNLVLLFIGGYSIYYFIFVIVQCYFALPLVRKYMLNLKWGGNSLYINDLHNHSCLYGFE